MLADKISLNTTEGIEQLANKIQKSVKNDDSKPDDNDNEIVQQSNLQVVVHLAALMIVVGIAVQQSVILWNSENLRKMGRDLLEQGKFKEAIVKAQDSNKILERLANNSVSKSIKPKKI